MARPSRIERGRDLIVLQPVRDVGEPVAAERKIMMPNGMWLDYGPLEWDGQERGYKIGKLHVTGRGATENLTQALARIVMTDALLPLAREYRVVQTVYDEIVCCVPDAQAEACAARMQELMAQRVAWLPELPVAVEVAVVDRYGKRQPFVLEELEDAA